jgi:hypothetical protein
LYTQSRGLTRAIAPRAARTSAAHCFTLWAGHLAHSKKAGRIARGGRGVIAGRIVGNGKMSRRSRRFRNLEQAKMHTFSIHLSKAQIKPSLTQ